MENVRTIDLNLVQEMHVRQRTDSEMIVSLCDNVRTLTARIKELEAKLPPDPVPA
jgi:hypothetical protein